MIMVARVPKYTTRQPRNPERDRREKMKAYVRRTPTVLRESLISFSA